MNIKVKHGFSNMLRPETASDYTYMFSLFFIHGKGNRDEKEEKVRKSPEADQTR